VIRAQNGTQLFNFAAQAFHLSTVVYTTQAGSSIYNGTTFILATGAITGGTVAIAATSTSVTCTAMIMQPTTTAPVGVQLHMTRFNPLAGTAE